MAIVSGRHYYYSHFVDTKTEVERGCTWPLVCEWQILNFRWGSINIQVKLNNIHCVLPLERITFDGSFGKDIV